MKAMRTGVGREVMNIHTSERHLKYISFLKPSYSPNKTAVWAHIYLLHWQPVYKLWAKV